MEKRIKEQDMGHFFFFLIGEWDAGVQRHRDRPWATWHEALDIIE